MYAQNVLNRSEIRELDAVLTFFELSPLSFALRHGTTKWKEDQVVKIPKRAPASSCCLQGSFQQPRWLILKDTYLVYFKRTRNIGRRSKSVPEQPKVPIEQALARPLDYRNLPGQHPRRWRWGKVILMDDNFRYKSKLLRGQQVLKFYHTHGTLTVILQSQDHLADWIMALNRVIRRRDALEYTCPSRYASFAPPRNDVQVCTFIDGATYMEAVSKGIEQAVHEIYITDWCLNPEIFLRRPIKTNHWRLDMQLMRKANEGLRICILLYWAPEQFLSMCTRKTAYYLNSLHPNIKVYLHPFSLKLWSHHEKMVIIDQSVVFLGGIDLCFGRWDTIDHRLEDTYKSLQDEHFIPKPRIIPRRDTDAYYSTGVGTPGFPLHARSRPSTPKSELRQSTMFPESQPKLTDKRKSLLFHPGLTVRRTTEALHRAGDAIQQLFRPHGQHASDDENDFLFYLDNRRGSAIPNAPHGQVNEAYESNEERGLDSIRMNSIPKDLNELCRLGERCMWIGQDYVNWNSKEPMGREHPAFDLDDREVVPRMPWHDVACAMSGTIAGDFARHFIQRWNAIRASVCRVQALRSCCNWSLTIPTGKKKRNLRGDVSQMVRNIFKPRGKREENEEEDDEEEEWAHSSSLVNYRSDQQSDSKSAQPGEQEQAGLETSIMNAYVDCILKAKRFVLIENQFFVSYILMSEAELDTALESRENSEIYSAIYGDNCSYVGESLTDGRKQFVSAKRTASVKNRIVEALFLRILRAHREAQPFRVFILIPLVPGFEGEVGTPSGVSQHKLMRYTRQSLFFGDMALLSRLAKVIPDPEQYISVCGLRTYDEWPDGSLKSELIYIHSKVLIADDERMILGSANLNDRSMLGKRDSEVAVLIESNSVHNGTEPKSESAPCSLIRRFRRSLMAEHLGVLPQLRRRSTAESSEIRIDGKVWNDEMLNDPVSDEFFNGIWKKVASRNTELFDEVFNTIPSEKLKTFEDCRIQRELTPLCVKDRAKAMELVKQIQGTLVIYPSRFLLDEDLNPPMGSKELLLPAYMWT